MFGTAPEILIISGKFYFLEPLPNITKFILGKFLLK